MKPRVFSAGVYAVVLGLWMFADQKSLSLFPGFQDEPAQLGFLALTVVAGFAVGRWWVLASLIGGLLPLIYLQETGYLGHGFDGADPIAPSSVSELVWLGLSLLLGVGIRRLWDYLRPRVAGAV
jgi:hypothetical protein